jgi:hypothetical protein
MFDFIPYGTKTTEEVLSIVKSLNFSNYTLLNNKGAYGNCNLDENFFIWKHKSKGEYIRICLISKGWHSDRVFYWNLEKSFKPFNYNWNHREGANIKSIEFKGNDEETYLREFKEMVKNTERYIKTTELVK